MLIWSVLLYACETWCLTIYKNLRLWKCGYGKMENITWKDNVSSETVIQRVGEKQHLIENDNTLDWSCVARRYTRKRYFGRQDKRKEAKWKTSMHKTRLDEEKRQWLHISVFEGDGTVSNYVDKLVSKTALGQRT